MFHLMHILTLAFIFLCDVSISSCAPSNQTDGRLMLTPLIRSNKIAEAKAKSTVSGLPLNDIDSYSGFITVNDKLGNHLFFWLFIPKCNPDVPLFLWVNGGPGTSSLHGLFVQHGPLKLNKDKKTISPRNENETLVGPFAVLYVDNSVGFGFSYSDSGEKGFRTSQDEYGGDLVEFVKQILILFPEYRKDRKFFIGGQSYGAKHATTLADMLLTEGVQINLKGVFVGGGIMDPVTLFPATQDWSFALGILSDHQRKEEKRKILEGFTKLKNGLLYPTETTSDIYYSYSNYTLPGSYDNILRPEWFDYNASAYIGQINSLRKSLHVGSQKYEAISDPVYYAYNVDMRSSVKPRLARLLNSTVKVLVYNGMLDFVSNTVGLEAMLLTTPWYGLPLYKKEIRQAWKDEDNKVLGYYSSIQNLCRVVLAYAGHNLGHYIPKVYVEMLIRFADRGCI